jgi:hypothetical protein
MIETRQNAKSPARLGRRGLNRREGASIGYALISNLTEPTPQRVGRHAVRRAARMMALLHYPDDERAAKNLPGLGDLAHYSDGGA